MGNNEAAFDKKNIAINWAGTQGGAGVAVCNGKHIQYAIPDNDRYLTILTSDLTIYQNSHDFNSLNNWQAVSVKSKFPGSASEKFRTKYFLSIVALGVYNYIFWVNTNNEYMVLRSRPDMMEPMAIAKVDFSETRVSSHDYVIQSNIAAITLPADSPDLTGKIGLVAIISSPGKNVSNLTGLLLDPAEFIADSHWKAQDHSYGTWPNIDPSGISPGTIASHYNDLSAAWISQGNLQVHGTDAPSPYSSLVIICHTESSNYSPSYYSYAMPLMDLFLSDRSSTTPSIVPVHSTTNLNPDRLGATMYTTPDGTIYSVFVKDGYVRRAKLLLNTLPSSDSNYGKPGLYSPKWQPCPKDLDEHNPSVVTHNTPCVVFISLPTTVGNSPCQVVKPDGSNSKQTYPNCYIQKYIQCILGSGNDNKPQMSTYYWGALFGIPNYIVASIPAASSYATTMLVSMVCDSFPYPIPNKSVWGEGSPSGMVNWLCCAYEYLVGDNTEIDLDFDLSASIGYKSEELFTVSGIGLQTEESLSTGFSTMISNSDSTFRANSFSVTTKGLPRELTGPNPDDAKLTISTEGALFGTTPAEQIGVDMYLVMLRGASDVTSSVASATHPILNESVVDVSAEYRSYCYTPGNLLSYQTSVIDTTMRDQFIALSDAQKNRFIINGEDFRSYYENWQYTKKIIERFGTAKFGPSGNLPYMEFSFSESGLKRTEFQSTSNFTVGAGAFLNGSVYAGIGWDYQVSGSVGEVVSVSFPLIGSTGYVMLGTEFSTSIINTTSTTSNWGLKLGEYLNPLAPGEAYSVRMYFLQPSPLWALELEYFGFPTATYSTPPNIDLSSSIPVRVMFTVPYISDRLANRLSVSFPQNS